MARTGRCRAGICRARGCFEIKGTPSVGVRGGSLMAGGLVRRNSDQPLLPMGSPPWGAGEQRSWWRISAAADSTRAFMQGDHSQLRAGPSWRGGARHGSDTPASASADPGESAQWPKQGGRTPSLLRPNATAGAQRIAAGGLDLLISLRRLPCSGGHEASRRMFLLIQICR